MEEKETQERQAPNTPDAPARKKRRQDNLREWVQALGIALVLALFLTQVVFVNAVVPSESMEDTIQVGDRLLGFRLAYWFGQPQRGDVVIFRYPDDEQQLYVKRIVGLPGEEVEVKDGVVYINGQETPQVNLHIKGAPSGNFGPWQVPQDSYFMLGDNRCCSWDSRYWESSYVHRDKLVGKVLCRLFPHPGKVE